MANVKEILIGWLKSHKYEGLCNPDIECGCGLDDFMPCGGDYGISECEPAMKEIAKDDDNEYGNYEAGDEVFVPIKEPNTPTEEKSAFEKFEDFKGQFDWEKPKGVA